MKQRTYYYRGDVERWVPSRRSYAWRKGYSENSKDGFPTYPWNTMTECRTEARDNNVKAIFA